MKRDLAKLIAWQQRSRANAKWKKTPIKRSGARIKARKPRRAAQERAYLAARPSFLENHPICPVTGERTSQIHHSAHREEDWLNLKRHWIAVSMEGHRWIEDNKITAEKYGLIVKINLTYEEYRVILLNDEENLDDPIFYKNWNGKTIDFNR